MIGTARAQELALSCAAKAFLTMIPTQLKAEGQVLWLARLCRANHKRVHYLWVRFTGAFSPKGSAPATTVLFGDRCYQK